MIMYDFLRSFAPQTISQYLESFVECLKITEQYTPLTIVTHQFKLKLGSLLSMFSDHISKLTKEGIWNDGMRRHDTTWNA